MAASLGALRPEFMAVGDGDVTGENNAIYELFSSYIGSTTRAEYLPRWVKPRPYSSAALRLGEDLPVVPLEGELTAARRLFRRPVEQGWWVEVASPQARLSFPVLYYPGWQGYIDGQTVSTEPVEGAGTIALTVPQGEHEVILRLERTPLRGAAEVASLIGLVIVLGMGIGKLGIGRLGISRLGIGKGVLGLVVLVVGLHLLPKADFSYRSLAPGRWDTLTLGWQRMPFPHHNPQGVPFADGSRLLGYALSAVEVEAGDTLEVTLRWGVSRSSLMVTVRLVSPAAHLFGVPDVWAEDAKPIEATTVHRLPVPEDIPTGVYFLQVRLHDEQGEVPPQSPTGERLWSLVLRPVRVRNRGTMARGSPLARFGSIALSRVRTWPEGEDKLGVELIWQTERPLAARYAVSLRPLGEAGQWLAQADAQPGCGFLPTSSWRPGEAITDRRWIPLPHGVRYDDVRAVEIVLYDPASPTLAPLGVAYVPVGEREHSFAVPPFSHQVNALFGDAIALLGYDLQQDAEAMTLTLHWRAERPLSKDYRIFVHLFDPTTETIAAQYDAMPLHNTYPTRWWQPGEVVSDEIRLSLDGVPAGRYSLAVGLYDPQTLERLPGVDARGQPIPQGRLILIADLNR